MNNLDAESVRPLFEQLQGSVYSCYSDPLVSSDAFLDVVQDSSGKHRIRANAGGFVFAGLRLIQQGLNATGLPTEEPLDIKLERLTIRKDSLIINRDDFVD